MTAIQKSLHEPVAVLLAKLAPEGAPSGTVLPLPQRNPLAPDLGGYVTLIEQHRRAIQSAIASNFLPTVAQRQNEKSGRALERIEQSSQKGTFHFIDHYEGMIRQVGVVVDAEVERLRADVASVVVVSGDDYANTTVAFTIREISEQVPIVALALPEESIDILVDANKLPRTPAVDEIFTAKFLPPAKDLPKKLF